MLEPHLLDAVRMALEKVEQVNVTLRAEQTLPDASSKNNREVAPIPVLWNRSRSPLGRLDQGGDICGANTGLVGERDHDEVGCRSPYDDIEAHTERGSRSFLPFRIDRDGGGCWRHGCNDLFGVGPEDNHDVIDRPTGNVGEHAIDHRGPADVTEVLRTGESGSGFICENHSYGPRHTLSFRGPTTLQQWRSGRIDHRDRIPKPCPHLNLGKRTIVQDMLHSPTRGAHRLTEAINEIGNATE